MKDRQLTMATLPDFWEEIQIELEKEKVLLVTAQPANTGKWGMARLWRMWMETTATWMAGRGATMPLVMRKGKPDGSRPFNNNDAHELFTSTWMGVDGQGVRLSWAKSAHDGMRPATIAERFDAMRKHEQWCIEKGIQLFKPRGNEYTQLEDKQNE